MSLRSCFRALGNGPGSRRGSWPGRPGPTRNGEWPAPLAQDTNLAAIAEAVGPRTADEVVALVGHEPWMSELASVLLTGSASRLAGRFDKSGVMGIEAPTIAAAAGRLVFFTPTSP